MDWGAVREITEVIGASSYSDHYDFGEHHGYQGRRGKFILSVEVKNVLKGVPEDITRHLASDFVDSLILTAWGEYAIKDKHVGNVSNTKVIMEGDEEVANISFRKDVVQIKTSRTKFRVYDSLDFLKLMHKC